MAHLWSLRGLSWKQIAQRACRSGWEDEIFAQSAQLAFYFFFALFPVLLFLFILLTKSAGAGSHLQGALVDSLKQLLPHQASALVANTVRQLNTLAVFGSEAVLAAVAAVWGGLNATWGIISGLNKAYEVEEERPPWRVFCITLGLAISLGFLGLIALVMMFYGQQVGDFIGLHLGAPGHLDLFWRIIQWAIIVVVMLFSFALVYRFGPNLKNRRWRWSIPGAAVAVVIWIISTLVLRAYQEHFTSTAKIYGGVSAVITVLLWLYMVGAAIFMGGETNSEIETALAESGHTDGRAGRERRSGSKDKPDKKIGLREKIQRLRR